MTVEMAPEIEDITLEDVFPYEDDEDPNRRTHIVSPPENMHIWQEGWNAQDIVNHARMHGLEVTALCGYKWVPVHNPEKFEACKACFDIAGQIMQGLGQ